MQNAPMGAAHKGRAFLQHPEEEPRHLERCSPCPQLLLELLVLLLLEDKHLLAAQAGSSPARAQRGLCEGDAQSHGAELLGEGTGGPSTKRVPWGGS